jgi:cytochrome c oxidase subunit IV
MSICPHPLPQEIELKEREKVSEKRAAAYRLGIITAAILAVLTIIEYLISVSLTGSTVLLFIIALIKAAVIVQNFMHIARLWREESH